MAPPLSAGLMTMSVLFWRVLKAVFSSRLRLYLSLELVAAWCMFSVTRLKNVSRWELFPAGGVQPDFFRNGLGVDSGESRKWCLMRTLRLNRKV